MGRNLNLTDNGEIRFFEGTGGGTNKVTIKTAATLAADYTLTLPPDDGAANTFLQTDGSGVLTWNTSTATLASAYTNGAKITTASATPVEIEVGASSANVALLLDQDDDFAALSITKDGTGAGEGILLVNSGTGDGISIQCTAVARGLFINQDGAAIGLEIDQDGGAIALKLNQASANAAIDLVQAANAVGLNILKSGTGAGNAVTIENDGTGNCLLVNNDGDSIGLLVTQSSAASTAGSFCADFLGENAIPTVRICSTTTAGQCLAIVQATDAVALALDSDATSTNPVITSEQNGAGNNLFLNQDGDGIALDIDSEATGNPLINLAPVTGNTRGDISFSTARTADPSGPTEGDIWYNAAKERLSMIMGDGISRTISGRRVTMDPPYLVTIATGVSALAGGTYVQLAAESGTADDLDTLSPVVAAHLGIGDIAVLRADTGDTITVKHNTGNIHLTGDADQALVNNNQLMLIYGGSDWYQLTAMTVIA